MTTPMHCIVCKNSLAPLGSETAAHPHPAGALVFHGTAPFGSRYDTDPKEIGLDHFEIYICDDCWQERRALSVGVKVHTKTERLFYSGSKVADALQKTERGIRTDLVVEEFPDGKTEDF